MTKLKIDLLCSKVEIALSQLNLDKLQRLSNSNWKYTLQEIDAQIVVVDAPQNDTPYLILYFKVIELEENQKPIAIEELMKANMQLTTKYGLMENRVIQTVEYLQTDELSSDSILLAISTYINHVSSVHLGLNQLFEEKMLQK